jgi:peptidoglycan DL-endopeptidase CwlO
MFVVVAVSAAVPGAHSAPGSLNSARDKASRLEARIEAQGEQLSIANERYNAAQYRRALLLADLSNTQASVASSERRYQALRDRLGSRVRALYKHPGAPMEAWFNMKSLDHMGRQRVLSDSVLTADSQLVTETDRARRELRAKMQTVSALSADAKRTQEVIAGQRIELSEGLSSQRSLLSQVKGDIARILAEKRRLELARAAQTVRAPSSDGFPANTEAQNRAANGAAPTDKKDDSEIPGPPSPKAGASKAVSVAAAQIGKPYKWGAAGPDSFDCSGLTMYAWAAAGVQLAHFAASQYETLPKVPRSQLAPGDLVFFGNPIHHVGIYEGGGVMIAAPQTGENVKRQSIARMDYLGASRP